MNSMMSAANIQITQGFFLSSPFRLHRLRHAVLALGAVLVLMASAMAQAQTARGQAPAAPAQAVVAGVGSMAAIGMLPAREIHDRLIHIGYSELGEINWADGLYKVKAVSADGRAVKLYLDGRSGTLVDVHTRR